MKRLILKGGYCIDPSSGKEGYWNIEIRDDRVYKIFEPLEQVDETDATVIDASGFTVAPGLVDVHVHFRDPGFTYKEDIVTGARAAAKGGYTSVVLMANTNPVTDNLDTLKYVLEKGKETGINIYCCASVTKGLKGTELTDMDALSKAGCVGFTDDGIPIMDENILRSALKIAAGLGKPVSLHEEDKTLITENGINAGGSAAKHYGITGSPREAEITMVKRDVAIALEERAPLSIQHISCLESVDIVRQAKMSQAGEGKSLIHAEAAPHHFSLTEDDVITYGSLAKMNPPLRTEADRLAIIKGLCDGTIDMIATDHAPHSKEEKEQPITKAPSGIIGLETALSLGIKNLVNAGYMTTAKLLKLMSTNPASVFGLPGGSLQEGSFADIVIFDKDENRVVTDFSSKSDNSPFKGMTLPGEVKYTICAGEVVYNSVNNKADNLK